MKIIEIEGEQLAGLLATLRSKKITPRKLRVAIEGDHVKFKVNEYMWSPPMGNLDPMCEFALARSAREAKEALYNRIDMRTSERPMMSDKEYRADLGLPPSDS